MRIGLVLERFEPSRGGREQWTFGFAQRLASRGHEVHVVSRESGPAACRLPLTLHRVQCERSPLAFAEAAQATVESLGLEIVHDMGAGWCCDVFQPHGGSWASVTDRKLLFVPPWLRWAKRQVNRLLPRHRELRKLMIRQYADHGQIVLALSRSAAAEFQRFHQIPRERIRIIYNGVNTERFSPERCAPHREATRRRLGLEPGTILALLVAHNFRLKGVATLLQAMARFKAERVPLHLAIVGGKRIDPWRARAQRLGVQGAVTFVGQVEDPVPYYAAADLYVHPTFYDPCSLVVLEAAACGLPIITSRYNGAAELFREDAATRLISDPGDPEELSAAMRPLLDESARRAMGAAARQTTLAHTFDRNVDRILAVYEEILDSRAGPPRGCRAWHVRLPGTGNPAADRGGPPQRAADHEIVK